MPPVPNSRLAITVASAFYSQLALAFIVVGGVATLAPEFQAPFHESSSPVSARALARAGFATIPWPAGAEEDEQLLALAPDVGAIVTVGTKSLPVGFLAAAGRLGLICCLGARYEAFDPEGLAARGVRLANVAGANAEDVADHAIGLLIAAQRRLVEADGWVRAGRWPAQPVLAHRLRGRRLGVIGLGAIGSAVARRAESFGLEVAWSGPNPKSSTWRYFAKPLDLAQWADALILCCRPTLENKGLVGQAMLAALGPDGILVNVARGSLVDEGELIAALRGGRIAGAALDVFTEEPTDPETWRGTPNLTVHPHGGAPPTRRLRRRRP